MRQISREMRELALKRFHMLAADKEYAESYALYHLINRKIRKLPNGEVKDDLTRSLFELWREMRRKWRLHSLIDPKLKVTQAQSQKPVRPKSKMAKIIYGLGLSLERDLIDPKKKRALQISRPRHKEEKNLNIAWAALLVLSFRKSKRQVSRKFNKSEGTIRNWIKTYHSWPPDKQKSLKEKVVQRFFTSRDAYSNSFNLSSYQDFEHSLSNLGHIKRGMKKKVNTELI